MGSRFCLLVAVMGSVLLVACDGSSPGTAASSDAGADMSAPPADAFDDVTPAAPDVGIDAPDVMVDGSRDVPALCLFDASIPFLELPDAGGAGGDGDGGAGDGGAGLVACLPCVATKCRVSINACLDDCACRVAFAGFAQCLAGGKAVLECAATLATLPPPVARLAQAPLLCAYTACGADCGLTPGN